MNAVVQLGEMNQLTSPAHLDGRDGKNRAAPARHSQLAARDDRSALLAWLARYVDSPATLASYRKEAERLLLWSTLQHGVALSDLMHEDLLQYQRFLSDPQPAERWVMRGGQKPARDSADWRPFAGPLSPASQRQAMSILNAMFSWLVQAGYLQGNPLALSRKRRVLNSAAAGVQRFLPQEHWAEVMSAIERLPLATERDKAHAARCRWLFSLLYIGGMRISEVATSSMGGFFFRRGADGRERWWLQVVGKGNKLRLIPATDELMAELRRYRESRGMASLPSAGEEAPLVSSIIGQPKPMARSALHEVVKGVMRDCAESLRQKGADFESAAAHIEKASAHWIRHTAGSHLSDKVDLKMVRDNLGHASITTTSIYLHSEDDARHDATSAAHRVGWKKD